PRQLEILGLSLSKPWPNAILDRPERRSFPGHPCHSYPLVCRLNSIPYLINHPGSSHWVKGELYSMSTCGLDCLDELEGTALGHYERLPIQTQAESEAEAEAYYAHRSFREELWEKNGREVLSEYIEREASGFVRREDRPKDWSFVD
ncbi:hypothetical protein SO802_029552, partial [Lithocarpus litseifolius]